MCSSTPRLKTRLISLRSLMARESLTTPRFGVAAAAVPDATVVFTRGPDAPKQPPPQKVSTVAPCAAMPSIAAEPASLASSIRSSAS
jgi:hypothetical protein